MKKLLSVAVLTTSVLCAGFVRAEMTSLIIRSQEALHDRNPVASATDLVSDGVESQGVESEGFLGSAILTASVTDLVEDNVDNDDGNRC